MPRFHPIRGLRDLWRNRASAVLRIYGADFKQRTLRGMPVQERLKTYSGHRDALLKEKQVFIETRQGSREFINAMGSKLMPALTARAMEDCERIVNERLSHLNRRVADLEMLLKAKSRKEFAEIIRGMPPPIERRTALLTQLAV